MQQFCRKTYIISELISLKLIMCKYVSLFLLWTFFIFIIKIFMLSFRRPRTCIAHVRYCNRYSNNARVTRKRAICSCDCQILVMSSVQRCDRFADEIGERGSYHRARGSLSDHHKPTESSEYHLRRMKVDQRRGRSVEKRITRVIRYVYKVG